MDDMFAVKVQIGIVIPLEGRISVIDILNCPFL